jgi:hypothetical protein
MKTMTCKQLGGACNEQFHSETFEEMANMSQSHGMKMLKKNDEAHLKAMGEMQLLMQEPGAMSEWFESKKKEFDELPED